MTESEEEFTPYYRTTIRYTDPKDGERADRVYNVTGTGATQYQSEERAQRELETEMAVKVRSAMEKFAADNGYGNLEIA